MAFLAVALQAAQGGNHQAQGRGPSSDALQRMREALQLRLSGELTRFTDDELKAVVSLLSGPGVV